MTSHVQPFGDGSKMITTPAIEPSLEHFLSILSLRTLKAVMSDLQTLDREYFNDNVSAYKNIVAEARLKLMTEVHKKGLDPILWTYDPNIAELLKNGKVQEALEFASLTDCDYDWSKFEYDLRDMKSLIGEVAFVEGESG